MAGGNLIPNVPQLFIARQDISFASLGITEGNTYSIWKIGPIFHTYDPADPFNLITGLEEGEQYFGYFKTDFDGAPYLATAVLTDLIPQTMTNVFAGEPTAFICTVAVDFATAGITTLNTTRIILMDDDGVMKSYLPGDENFLTGFEEGKMYYIEPILDMDLSDWGVTEVNYADDPVEGILIQDEGVTLTPATKLNFTGPAVIATYNGVTDAIDVTITGGDPLPADTRFIAGRFTGASIDYIVNQPEYDHEVIVLIPGSGDHDVFMPVGSTCTTGKSFTFKRLGSGVFDLHAQTPDTFDGLYSSIGLPTDKQAVTVVWDGVTWVMLSDPYASGGAETDPTVDQIIKDIPVAADATTNKYLNWNGSAYIRKQIDYSEIGGTAPGGTTPGIDTVLAVGQALTADRTIAVGTNILSLTGSSSSAVIRATSTSGAGSSAAVTGIGGAGNGVSGTSTTGSGGSFSSVSGVALKAQSTSGVGCRIITIPASTNSVIPVLEIQRQSTGTAANGIGGSIDFQTEVDNGTVAISGQFISKWTNATNASRTSKVEINAVSAATTVKALGLFAVCPEYADNAAAITGGLTVGDVYRTGDLLKIVH